MTDDTILHDREDNEWSEQFLKDNREKFAKQCVDVLRLLYQGRRLTAKNANDILNIADGGRRLREIKAAKKECMKGKRITNGKVEGVEYFLEIPKQPTKQDLQEWFRKYQEEVEPPTYKQVNLF